MQAQRYAPARGAQVVVIEPSPVVQRQQQPQEPPVLHLVLRLRVEKRVFMLVDEMRESKLVSEDELNMFLTGFSELNPKIKDDHERISLQFCYVIYNIIEPALAQQQDKRKLLTLESFHTRVVKLLEETVPAGESVKEFMASYTQFALERQEDMRKWTLISQNAAESMRIAAETATRIHAKMVTQFEELKTRLKDIEGTRRITFNELHDSLKALEVRIKKAKAEAMKLCQDQSALADRMKQDTRIFNEIADLYENLLKKV